MATKTQVAPAKPSALMPVVIIVALVAIAGGAYYFFTKTPQGESMMQKTGMGSALMPRVSEKDFAFISDPLVKKHFVAQANTTSYRVKSTSSGKGGYSIMEMSSNGGDDLAIRMIDHNGDKERSDMITIGDTTYLKDYTDNIWWKQVAKPEPTGDPATETGMPEDETKPESIAEEYMDKQQVTYKKIGEEPCGNLTCYKYEETMAETPEGLRTFWFDTKKYLLRKEELGFGEFKSVNEYEYDGVSVKAPSPTKDVPEGKSIYEYIQVDGSMMPESTMLEKTIPDYPARMDETEIQGQEETPVDDSGY